MAEVKEEKILENKGAGTGRIRVVKRVGREGEGE